MDSAKRGESVLTISAPIGGVAVKTLHPRIPDGGAK